MNTTSADATKLPELLRERICDVVKEEPFFGQMDHFTIARTLVQIAFAWCDLNGGIDDTCHAAKQLHNLVDEAGTQKRSDYSPEKLQDYVRKTKRR